MERIQMNRKKILFLSDSPLTCTGYGRISTEISNYMVSKDWEVHLMGHNYIGQDLPPGLTFKDGSKLNFHVYGNGREPYCKDLIMPRIRDIKPDIFIILLDTFMLYPWLTELDFAPAKTIFYFPSDGGGQLPSGCENVLRKVNVPVAMAKFGQKQCKEVHNLDTLHIPHHVDTNNFYPLPDEERAKIRIKWGLTNKFVVGTVARNQGRKMLDRTIKAFAEFCKDKPDAILFMHTDPTDAAGVFDLNQLIFRYKLQNRVIFTGMKYYKGFDYKDLNELYNLMDVFLLSTSGEGFGIPIIESLACKVPVVATDYTTTPELVTDHKAGLGVKIAGEITGSWNVERAVMDIDECAKKLTRLYNEPKELKKMGENGLKAVKKYYSYDVVMKQWEELFNKLTND